MKVANIEQAWAEANKIFPTDYEKDEASSQRAGYDIYRHPSLNYYNRICDLGDRLEVLTGECGENVTNIWIVPEQECIRVCITYRMSKGEWDTAENCITTSIEKYRLEHINEEMKHNCWSTSMDCAAGIWITEMLKPLVKLQGYTALESWSIEAE